MLINITIKTSKNKCSYGYGRLSLRGEVTIREKGGNKINEITSIYNEKVKTSSLIGVEVMNSSSLLIDGTVWEKKKIETSLLEVILAWTFKNQGPDKEFDFTFQNIYYDPNSKRLDLYGDNLRNKLSLKPFSWEEKETFSPDYKLEKFDLWSAVDLGTNNDKIAIKNRLVDFVNLVEESNQIKDEIEKFRLDEFITHLSKFEKYRRTEENQELYELESFFTRTEAGFANADKDKIFKKIVESELEICQELKLWKTKDIPNLSLKMIKQARKNDFVLTKDNVEINSQGLYKGFSVFRTEQRRKKVDIYTLSGGEMENCYTKTRIDLFRQLSPHNSDQSTPQHFRGFQPGDLAEGKTPGTILYLSEKAMQENLTDPYVIKPDSNLQTKTYLDLLEAEKLNEFLEILCSNPMAYSEVQGRNKSEHLKVYQKAIDTAAITLNSEDKTNLNIFCKELLDLFLVLDKNYSTADQTTCQKGLNILATMDEGLNEWGEKIKVRFGTEITTKKTEIQSRIATFGSSTLSDQIKAAIQAEYGSSKPKTISPERAQIFTTHATEITTPALLGKIKDLLDILISAEEEKIKLNDSGGISSILTSLKNRWKNGNGDFKKAYEIVNKVDNQWADRLISQLQNRIGNESTLTQKREEFKVKWKNFAFAVQIFDNPILDSVSALEQADKLLIKVKTAQEKNEIDSSLLTELESYSQALTGNIKNKVYQAVNSFENQVQNALKHLREITKNRAKIIERLRNAKTESELTAAYQVIKNLAFYQSEKNKKLTDKIHQRKKICLEIIQDSTIPAAINQFLQTNLIKIISDSIQNEDDEKQLTELENELKTFSQDNQSGAKGKIYHQHKNIIEEILTEISQEKQRWSQINQPNSPQTNSETKGLPFWAISSIIGGLIILGIGLAVYYYLAKKKKTVQTTFLV